MEISEYLESTDLWKLHLDINIRKVLIKYLRDEVTDQDLKETFALFGEIQNAFISSDKKQLSNTWPSNYGIVIFKEKFSAYLALNANIVIKGGPVLVRLHRFRNVGTASYLVEGKEVPASSLLAVQIGAEPKHNIFRFLPRQYHKMHLEWQSLQGVYQQLYQIEIKKLLKECKRKKDKSLKRIIMQIEDIKKFNNNGGGAKAKEQFVSHGRKDQQIAPNKSSYNESNNDDSLYLIRP